MKKYIQYVAAALLVCLGLTSCAETFDEDDRAAAYPAEAPGFGAWVSTASADSGSFAKDFTYEINFTKTAAGDTVVNLTLTQKATGGTLVSTDGYVNAYDPETGVLDIIFMESEIAQPLGIRSCPARIQLTYNRNSDKLFMDDIYFYANAGNGAQWLSGIDYLGYNAGIYIDATTFVKAAHPKEVMGAWGTPDLSTAILLQQRDDEGNMAGMIVLTAEDNGAECTATYDAAAGVLHITDANGNAYTAAFNADSQLVLTTPNGEVVLDRVLL